MSTTSSLRLLEPEDSMALLRLYTSPVVRKHLGGPVSQALAEAKIAALYEPEQGSYVWAICGKPPAKPFHGLVTLANHHEAKDIEVSYALLPEHQGQGYAARAVEQVLAYAFAVLGIRRVVAETQTSNEASVRLAKRVGMKLERRLIRFGQEQSMFVAMPVGKASGAA